MDNGYALSGITVDVFLEKSAQPVAISFFLSFPIS